MVSLTHDSRQGKPVGYAWWDRWDLGDWEIGLGVCEGGTPSRVVIGYIEVAALYFVFSRLELQERQWRRLDLCWPLTLLEGIGGYCTRTARVLVKCVACRTVQLVLCQVCRTVLLNKSLSGRAIRSRTRAARAGIQGLDPAYSQPSPVGTQGSAPGV
jgi:hypothetical protein